MTPYNRDRHTAMLSPSRDFPPTRVRIRYCILSSPRTGSTLLSRALYGTRLAGDPLEYLNPRNIEAWCKSTGRPPIADDYLADMMARRTSPNGVFGIKAHFGQIKALVSDRRPVDAVARYLQGFDRIVMVRRDDRLGQGISHFRALASEIWSSEDAAFAREQGIDPNAAPDFDGARITEILNRNVRSEVMSRQAVNQAGVPFIEITYEALTGRYEATVRQVLDFLGVDGASAAIPEPQIARMADAQSVRLRRSYLEFIGVTPGERGDAVAAPAAHDATARHRAGATAAAGPRLAFLGVGAQKAGTSTLHRLLDAHPDVEVPGDGKEVHYFDTDGAFAADGSPHAGDYSGYHRRFRFDRAISGEVTPIYMYWAPSLERIVRYNPDIKLIALLRNPIARAFSQWGHNIRAGRKPPEFLEAIEAEVAAMHADPNGQSRHHSLLGRGLYHRQVTRLRAAIPAANVLIVKSEAFFGAQYETFRDICAFLGVGAPDRASFAEDHANRGAKLRPMRRVEWRRLRDLFADDVGRLAAELGWDCDDWLAEPDGLTD